MTVSENTGGTQTATISTKHTLATITTAGVYQLLVEMDNMADGDELELRIEVKVRSGSSSKVMFSSTYKHAQGADAQVTMSLPIPVPFQVIATLKQTAGTGRSFVWSLYAY